MKVAGEIFRGFMNIGSGYAMSVAGIHAIYDKPIEDILVMMLLAIWARLLGMKL